MAKPVYHRPWPSPDDDVPTVAWQKLFDLPLIEAILQQAARDSKALSYAETLNRLGYDFSRPKMRALCVALEAVDTNARLRGEPPLAVLVVRASDGIPGQGWWIGKDRRNYKGPLEGPQAAAYIKRKQAEAFRYWRVSAKKRINPPAGDLPSP